MPMPGRSFSGVALGRRVLSLGYLCLRGGVRDEISRFGWTALLAALVGALGTAAFIPAFKLTSVTNVVLIWATAPFVAAAIAWLIIGEKPGLKIMLSSVVALAGVGLTPARFRRFRSSGR